jgi:hypothetical protein
MKYTLIFLLLIMKNFLGAIVLISLATQLNAQTTAGNFMVGGNLLTSSISFQNDNTGFDLALQPKLGYFISQNIVLGLSAELGINAVKSNVTMNYGLTPFTRIYVGKGSVDEIPRRVMLFLEAGGGFGGRNSRYENTDGTKTNVTTNGGVFYIGPGIDLFLNKNVAFEAGAEYRYIGGKPNVSRIGINLGFQIFLSRSEAKKVYGDTKKDMSKM